MEIYLWRLKKWNQKINIVILTSDTKKLQKLSLSLETEGNSGGKTLWPSWDHSLWSHPSSQSHGILFSITWEIGMLKKRIHICCKINFTFLTSSLKSLFLTLKVQYITTSSIFLMRLTNHHSGKRIPIAKRYHSFHNRKKTSNLDGINNEPKFLFWVSF